MPLFEYEQITHLNERELRVCNYVTSHTMQVIDMSIRQLSEAVGVSTTTIFRFCEKVGCEGFQELKYRLKRHYEQDPAANWHIPQDRVQVLQFLQHLEDNTEMQFCLREAAEICANAKHIYCIGVGSSASMAEYGARYFASLRLSAVCIPDPFYPKPMRSMTEDVLIALSVSGETKEIICQAANYRTAGSTIISITNAATCQLAALSDININYYMPVFYAPQCMGPQNLTTQLPVIYLLETLARWASSLVVGTAE